MPMVVAISRQFGSGGARVGHAVAQRLGFRYADRDILAEAAKTLNVEALEVELLEESARGFWERLGLMFAQGAADTPFTPPDLPPVSESALFAVERPIIEAIARDGNAVIVGRGGAHILADRPDVLRVFLHASLSSRIALAMEEYHLADLQVATRIVRASDVQRARFVQKLCGRDWCDATLYDICLNTQVVGLERTADLIVDMVQQTRPATPLPPTAPRKSEPRESR